MSERDSTPGSGELLSQPIHVVLGQSSVTIPDLNAMIEGTKPNIVPVPVWREYNLGVIAHAAALFGGQLSGQNVVQWKGSITLSPSINQQSDGLFTSYSTTGALRHYLRKPSQIPEGLASSNLHNQNLLAVLNAGDFSFAVANDPVSPNASGSIQVTNSLLAPTDATAPFKFRPYWPELNLVPPPIDQVDNDKLASSFATTFMYVMAVCQGLEAMPNPGEADGKSFREKYNNFLHTIAPKDLAKHYTFSHIKEPIYLKPVTEVKLPRPPFSLTPLKDISGLRKVLSPQPFDLAPPLPMKRSSTEAVPSKEVATQSSVFVKGVDKVKPRYSFSDIGGLDSAKEQFLDIANFFLHPEIMQKWGDVHPRGILLHGEPGGGKKMLAHALAKTINAELWLVSSTVYGGHLGDAMAAMKNVFHAVKSTTSPTLLFFDEAEGIIGKINGADTGGGATAERKSVAAIFRTEMDELAESNPNVIVLLATNDPDRMDPAIIRSERFNYHIYVPRPDLQGRREIISIRIAQALGPITSELRSEDFMTAKAADSPAIYEDGIDVNELAEITDGMSPADIKAVFSRLAIAKARHELTYGFSPISHEDLVEAIWRFRQKS